MTPTVVLALACFARPAETDLGRHVVNPATQSNDSKPSLTVLSDGTIWMAWHAYFKPSRDRVLARKVGPGELGPVHQVSQQGTVHDAPVIVSSGDRGAWVLWSALLDGRWQLMGRRVYDGRWRPPVVLSHVESDALMPAAAQ